MTMQVVCTLYDKQNTPLQSRNTSQCNICCVRQKKNFTIREMNFRAARLVRRARRAFQCRYLRTCRRNRTKPMISTPYE